MTTLDRLQASHFDALVQSFGVANAMSAYRDSRAFRALGVKE